MSTASSRRPSSSTAMPRATSPGGSGRRRRAALRRRRQQHDARGAVAACSRDARARAPEARRRAQASTSGAPSTSVPRPSSVRPLHFRADVNGTSARTGCAAPPARHRGSPAASRCGPPRSPPAAGELLGVQAPRPGRRLERHDAKPVIGQRAGLVEAHDVDAREALDRVEALRERARGARAARRRRRT